jgi:hypothetical protein
LRILGNKINFAKKIKMQGDTIINNKLNDSCNTFFLYCIPCKDSVEILSALHEKTYDSLHYKYFFINAIKHNNLIQTENNIKTIPSFLSPHLLKTNTLKSKPINTFSNDWILFILLIGFLLYAWTHFFSSKRLKQLFNAPFTNRALNQLTRDGDIFKERISIPLIIIFLLSISLFIFNIGHYLINFKSLDLYNLIFFTKILGVISLLLLIKSFITRFIGNLFKNSVATSAYLLNSLIFNIITGLILLPVNVFLAFSNPVFSRVLIILSLIMLLIFNVIRFGRYIIIGVSYSKFSKFYLFLYLCTLEILPILILIKIYISLIDNYL